MIQALQIFLDAAAVIGALMLARFLFRANEDFWDNRHDRRYYDKKLFQEWKESHKR